MNYRCRWPNWRCGDSVCCQRSEMKGSNNWLRGCFLRFAIVVALGLSLLTYIGMRGKKVGESVSPDGGIRIVVRDYYTGKIPFFRIFEFTSRKYVFDAYWEDRVRNRSSFDFRSDSFIANNVDVEWLSSVSAEILLDGVSAAFFDGKEWIEIRQEDRTRLNDIRQRLKASGLSSWRTCPILKGGAGYRSGIVVRGELRTFVDANSQ